MFLIVVDAYSKWTEVCVMSTSTATAMVEKMRGIFTTHGLSVLVVSDNGPCFSSLEFKMFMKNRIRHIFTPPPSPILKWAGGTQCVHVQGSTEKDGGRQESNT